jgi:hypothetical protein
MTKNRLVSICILILAAILAYSAVLAHPGSGIVVDKDGNVNFINSGKGVAKLSPDGTLSYIHQARDGHWLCMDERGIYSRAQPTFFQRITQDGLAPALIYAGGGSPIIMGQDGNFYYC